MLCIVNRKQHARRVVGYFAACCLILCSAVLSTPAFAQTQQQKAAPSATKKPATQQPEQPTPPRPSWAVNCVNQDAGLVCSAGQVVVLRQGQRILRVNAAVRTDPKTKKPMLLIQLPLGVYLPAGITLKFGDSEAKAIVFQSCNPNGCVAEHSMNQAEIKTLLNGADLKLVGRAAADKSSFEFNVPAKGFSAAYAKITEK